MVRKKRDSKVAHEVQHLIVDKEKKYREVRDNNSEFWVHMAEFQLHFSYIVTLFATGMMKEDPTQLGFWRPLDRSTQRKKKVFLLVEVDADKAYIVNEAVVQVNGRLAGWEWIDQDLLDLK